MNTTRLDVMDLTGAKVEFVYTNWKGETRLRKALVKGFYWGESAYHTGEQLFMKARDLERPNEMRDFAVRDILSMEYHGDSLPTEPSKREDREPFWSEESGNCFDCGGSVEYASHLNEIYCDTCENSIEGWM